MKRYLAANNSILLLKIILALFYCSCFSAYANDINLRVQHFTTEEGLAQNYVDCIYRDSRDFVWIGTWYGLNRFDGYNFITYSPVPDKNSISNGFVNDIVEDKNGDLWIATRQGINKYVFETETFIHYFADSSLKENHISDNWVSSLLFDDENNLWIGTLSAGVEKITFDESLTEIQSVQRFNVDFMDPYGITSENVYCLLKDYHKNIYVGSILGLDRINTKTGEVSKYTQLGHPFFFEATVVHSLFEDSKNVLWIGTESGLISIDHAGNEQIRYPVDRASAPGSNKKALSHGLIRAVKEDPKGNILVGTLGGLHLLDRNKKEFFLFPDGGDNEYSLNSKFINDINCDSNGNVWVGTDKGGLNKYNVFQKQFYSMANEPGNANSLSYNIINSIYEDDTFLWIGTAGGGLNRYDKSSGNFSNYKHAPGDRSSISLDFISTIASNSQTKDLWLGTWGCGINYARYSDNTNKLNFKTYRYDPPEPDGPPFIYISSVLYDQSGNLWIARPDGLEIYDHKTKEFYPVMGGSAYGDKINGAGCLYIDNKENLWVGTTLGLHMIRLDQKKTAKELAQPDSVFTFRHNPNDSTTINGDFIVSILQDAQGDMWFSLYGKGISKIDHFYDQSRSASFIHYTMAEGLSNNVVYGMLEDEQNNLWLSTDRGLTRYNYIKNETKAYYESDGLLSNQFYWSAYHKSNSGRMYFGTNKGLMYFYPDSIKQNQFKPKVVITDFKLFNRSQFVNQQNSKLIKTISASEKIELNYNENIISFEFSALSYFSPDKNTYRYKMEGFDNEWTTATADRRYVTYTNLDPGEYSFHVTGSNNDGVWSDTGAAIKLFVHPPWWKTILFRVLFLVAVAGIIFLFFKNRIKSLEKKKLQLEKLVAERTQELEIKSGKLVNRTHELDKSNKELLTINKTKDKLFTIIAHDLKSPFNAIMGMLGLIVKRYDMYDDAKKKEMIGYVNDSSKKLYKLLENLLEWARAQTGNIEFTPKPFVLMEAVMNNMKLLEQAARDKNVEITCKCNAEIIVFADANLLDTVLRNLLNNAIKFTQDGSVCIEMERLASINSAEVRIVDTGIGIEPERIGNVFNISSEKTTAGTSGETGTGLGLVLCKEFVERNGGHIRVVSDCSKGSTFIFTIPLAETK